ncbi:MAG: DUF6615 family protein [Acidobacteriota bacterium]
MLDNLYTLPNRDRICRAFAFAALQTWTELRDFDELGEDSITDYRILQLKRMCPDEVRVIKFSRSKESQTGADWEWWFGSGHEWFGMRVQAKRLDIDSLEYKHLDHLIGKTGVLQINRLISDANSRNLYSMYCFYNYWPAGKYNADWPCGTFAETPDLWGASISDTHKIQIKVNSNLKKLKDIEPISMPLICLACCRGHADSKRPTLPHRARGIALKLNGNTNLVPPIVPHLPSYITQSVDPPVLDVQSPLDLDGILIIEENPNVYREAYSRR